MKKLFLLLTAILFFVLLPSTVFATVRYVTPTGAGTLAGTSWANASSDLQLTINNSSSGDEIWIAAGTYKPNRRADATGIITVNDRYNAFVLKSGVKIYGGFAGSETLLSQRNWTTNITTLSGDLGTGVTTDNAYHVVVSAGDANLPPEMENGPSVLDGFTITGGYAENWSSATINSQTVETCNGGGITCVSSSPTLKNLNISNCYAWYGGGMHNTASSPLLMGVILDSNTGVKNGGGMFNTSSSSPSIMNTIIRNNITVEDWTKGGGIYNASSSNPTITNSLIYKNNSDDGGGGIYSSGGTPTLINSTIVYNTMRRSGGTGGGVSGTMTLQNCVIWGNKASTSTNNVSGTPIYTNTLVEGVSGAGIISSSNPLFVDTSADNYRLTRFSPAINKGSNALNTTLTDLDENSRIFSGGIIDLGAYEYQSADAVFAPDANGILYVKKGSSGSGNSWANAIGELSDALFAASGLSSVTQIWVAAGTYFPTYAAGNGTTDRDKAFVLINNVKVYGGFAGTETALSQRNVNSNATILSGDIGTINETSDNCYHVLISAGSTGTACLDGFTITKGNANGSSSIALNTYTISQGSGGGIHLVTSDLTFSNLNVITNKATLGGGVSFANSTTTFSNSSIDSNTSTTNGGGIYCNVSRLTFNSVNLVNNTTTNGGGIFTEGWSSFLYLTNVAVKNNTATSGSGGGMYLYQIDNSSTYKGLLICNNQAGQNGGGIFTLNCTPTFVNLTLTENKAGSSGGGLYKGGDFTMKNCIIWGNTNSNTAAIDNCDMGITWYFDNTLLQAGTVNGTNIISNSNPIFVNSVTGDYHLTSTSPAKDIGNNSYISGVSTDLDGADRIFNTNVDLGAFEFHTYPIRVTGANGISDGTGYSTLKAAFDAINAQTNQAGKNIIVTVAGSTTETATASLNNGNWTRVSIYPTASDLFISGNLDATLINYNGADNVTIDGRLNATGLARNLTIENTNTGTSASTITFANNAETDTIKYCTIKGASLGINGTIYFFDGSLSKGNDSNVISNNLITNSGGNRPVFSVVSGGRETHPNTGDFITDNEFKDFLNPVKESSAIYARGYSSTTWGTTGWTITGNSFYETTSFVPTGNNNYRIIKIGDSETKVAGVGYTISNNFIGGSSASCVGTWTKTSNGGTANNSFSAVALNLYTGNPVSSIQNNTIKNFNWANSGGVAGSTVISWSGIEIGKGSVNVGTVTGNTIGDNVGTGSIVVTGGNADSNGSKVCGIQIQWNALVDCQNNKIGSITTANSASTHANHFYGVYNYSNNATTISNNIIGSTTTANSINATSTSTGHDQHVYGILCTNNSGSTPGAVTISGNMIANMTDGATNNSAYINGIRSESSSTVIINNTVRDLSIVNNNTQSNSQASNSGIAFDNSSSTAVTITNNVVYNLINSSTSFTGYLFGIYCNAGSAANNCSNNNIYNLSATNATGAANVVGLSYDAGLGANTLSRNFIYGLKSPSSTNGFIYGIKKNSGAVTLSNNIITIGENTLSRFFGIYESGTVNNNTNLYFNTVYIGGSPVSGVLDSYALYSNTGVNTRNFRNNIFSNCRSNNGATGKHYAAWFNYNANTNLTLSSNDYYTPGTGGVIGRYNNSDVTSVPIITGLDSRSESQNPAFVGAGTTIATDYKIGVDLVGVSDTEITTDYESATRGTCTAMGAWERVMNHNSWRGTISSVWSNADNWLYHTVPASDENIFFADAPSNNCSLDADVSITNLTNAQSTYKFVLNGHKAVIKGNLDLSNGAQLDASAAGSTIEFAGTSAQSIPLGTFYSNNVYNLTVSNTSNLTLNGQLNILNSLASTAGKLDAMTNSPTICYAGTSAQLIDSIPYLNGKVYNLTIDNAAGVSLSNDFVVDHLLTVNSGKSLIIPTARKLNVLGTITNNAGVAGILVKSGPSVANGTLIFHNAVDNPVYATVEMYSKAFYDSNGPTGFKYKWQYFGIPVRSLVSDPTFYGSHLRQYNEPGKTAAESWVTLNNSSVLTSFKGYEMTQTSPKTIYFQGILENADMNCNLTNSSGSYYKGQHIISNPYTASIEISQLNFTDMEATIYLYNTGSHDDWNNNSGVTTPGTSPGQYVAAPKNTSGSGGIPTQIPSMQGFMVTATSNTANLSVPYSSLVVKNSNPQRVKKSARAEDKIFTIIDVNGSRYNDKIWLFTDPACTHSFDNGWDGFKIFGSSQAPQIYAMETDGNYQISTVNNIDNTDIGFKAGEDSNYTLTFNHKNRDVLYPTLYLVDLLENKTIDITESGSTYTFTSNSASTSDKRFKIVTNPNISTELAEENMKTCPNLKVYSSKQTIYIENNTAQKGDLTLYDSMGRIVDIIPFNATKHTAVPTKLKSGVCLVKAFTAKKTIVVSLVLP